MKKPEGEKKRGNESEKKEGEAEEEVKRISFYFSKVFEK